MSWSRPPLAEPPAESPSTIKSSDRSTSFVTQSASFCGMPPDSSAPFRLIKSRALRAASRACAARIAFKQIFFDSEGCSSSHAPSSFETREETIDSTSGLRSFSFVWLLNCGSVSFTEIMVVKPSRRSSPLGVNPLISLLRFAYALTVRVSEVLKPETCVPPSGFTMLLPKARSTSLVASVYCIAISQIVPVSSSVYERAIGELYSFLPRLR